MGDGHGEGDDGVAEMFADDLAVNILIERGLCVGVAEDVKPGPRYVGLDYEASIPSEVVALLLPFLAMWSLLETGGYGPCDCHAPLCALNCLAGDSRGNIFGFVCSLGLERQEPTQVLYNLGAVGSGKLEQSQNSVVNLASGTLTEACTAHRSGCRTPHRLR